MNWKDSGIYGLGKTQKSAGTCIKQREYNTLAKYISTGNCIK